MRKELKNFSKNREECGITAYVPYEYLGFSKDYDTGLYYCNGVNRDGYNWLINEFLPDRERKSGIDIDFRSLMVTTTPSYQPRPAKGMDGKYEITLHLMAYFD
jgi:hypothetical protein